MCSFYLCYCRNVQKSYESLCRFQWRPNQSRIEKVHTVYINKKYCDMAKYDRYVLHKHFSCFPSHYFNFVESHLILDNGNLDILKWNISCSNYFLIGSNQRLVKLWCQAWHLALKESIATDQPRVCVM